MRHRPVAYRVCPTFSSAEVTPRWCINAFLSCLCSRLLFRRKGDPQACFGYLSRFQPFPLTGMLLWTEGHGAPPTREMPFRDVFHFEIENLTSIFLFYVYTRGTCALLKLLKYIPLSKEIVWTAKSRESTPCPTVLFGCHFARGLTRLLKMRPVKNLAPEAEVPDGRGL